MRRIDRSLRTGVPQRHFVTEPVAHADLGETIVVEAGTCCQPIIRAPEDVRREVYVEREETGPIYVNGIQAGDMLRVDILAIEVVGHGSGWQYNDKNEIDYHGNRIDFIEINGDTAILPGGFEIGLEPMIGCISVVPKLADEADYQKRIRYDLGNCGGNLDYRDICPGSSVCLRAEHDGGLLFLGDMHARQGWGEWLGMAIEVAGNATIRLEKETRFASERPVILKDGSFTVIVNDWPYRDAVKQAMEEAAHILAHLSGVDFDNSLKYCKMLGHVRHGQLWHIASDTLPWGRPTSEYPVVVGVEVPIPNNTNF